MVRLGAVLCGSFMYGLARLARYGLERIVAVGLGMAGKARFVPEGQGVAWLAVAGLAWCVVLWIGWIWLDMAGYKRR